MRRRGSVNAALFALVATLATLAWLAASGPDGRPPLTSAEPRQVTALELAYPRDGSASLALERREDGWWLRRPLERRARDGRVVTALRVLAARGEDCYARAAHDPAEFGLAPPRLRLEAEGATVEFGDRAADGRRYVAAGDRFCLLPDRHYPLLQSGLDGVADLSLLGGRALERLATPAAEARRRGDDWTHVRGEGDAAAWAARWRAARGAGVVLEPPDANLGRVRAVTAAGIREWRIVAREPALLLVPTGADYALEFAPEAGPGLLDPAAAAGE